MVMGTPMSAQTTIRKLKLKNDVLEAASALRSDPTSKAKRAALELALAEYEEATNTIGDAISKALAAAPRPINLLAEAGFAETLLDIQRARLKKERGV
jgi:hypothetical protein